ncbi:hypothetical protein C1646_775917 [Rhizophagus diaphanus]|nr:hypothetical protein C1646_775917 [Rhizophagus diaphanus] [Rhizophagus sp. MUCL 43196]
MQNMKISNIKKYLEKRVEKKEVEISDEMASIVNDVAKRKSNGTRYHPMFLHWAISVYSKSEYAAYNAMKTIMRLPSISTLKSYINENEQSKLECVGIYTIGSICDRAGENRQHIKSFDWYASKWFSDDIVEIIDSNLEKTKFTVHRLNSNNFENVTIERSFVRPAMASKLEWKVNDLCEFKKISGITEGRPAKEGWQLRNNLSKSHIGEKNAREIMFNKKEISWKYIKGVYEHTNKHATVKATKLTKYHIWLTSWSKMRVDLAEHTLLKEVKDALRSIKELKDISEGIRSSKDLRIDTLKEIRDWFICGDKQKTEFKEWISPQYVFEGLFGVIRKIGGDSSTHTLKSYGHALNKCQVVALVSSEVKSINYEKADSTGTDITTLTRSLLVDDLIMEKINIPLGSHDKNVEQENSRIFYLQNERYNLIEAIFYKDSIDELLQKWQNIPQ